MDTKKKIKEFSPASSPVALVIAASGGVGEETARLLSAEGYTVIGTCRTAAQAKELKSRGVCHHVVLMDLQQSATMVEAFKELDDLGIKTLKALVYCAGAMYSKPIEQESIERMRQLYEVNVFGAVKAVQLALPKIHKTHGRIVLIGSASGGYCPPLFGAYASSKFAIEAVADALRIELREAGISVSLVIPGGIKTAMTERQVKETEADIEELGPDAESNYAIIYKRHKTLLGFIEKGAQTPAQVASYAIKAVTDKKPKARYFTSIDQTITRAAVRAIPDSIMDGAVPKILDFISGDIKVDNSYVSMPWGTKTMNQLSAFDTLMLHGESNRTPMHVSPFFIYDVSTAPNGLVRFKDILRTFERRIDLAPLLRRKIVRVPFGLDEPYWADDSDFDIEQHVRHVALPSPGDRRQLQILLARLTAYPMDLSRPPWDAYVIEGLDSVSGIPTGSFGLLLRIHHAAIDGHSGHAILQALHDLSPTAPEHREETEPYIPWAVPSTAQMLSRAYVHFLSKPKKIVQMVANVVPRMQQAKTLERENPHEERQVPETRFSGKVSSHRTVILQNLDMESLRPVRAAADDATLNDVIVSIVSGAMRRYLDSKGELPAQSMTTGMPINVRTEADADKHGNVVSLTKLSMHSDIADPLERVKAIHASAIFTKAYNNAIGARMMSEVAESIPAGITTLGIKVSAAVSKSSKAIVNTIVTNVPGPQVPLYLAGAKVIEFHAVGIIVDGLGIFHSVNSYCGRLGITVLAEREMLPDPDFYEECLIKSYEEHLTAAAKRGFIAKTKTAAKPKNQKSKAPQPRKAIVTAKKTAVKSGTAKAKTANRLPNKIAKPVVKGNVSSAASASSRKLVH
jgi:diacylglycerol O-acyltransferase / wax synthase